MKRIDVNFGDPVSGYYPDSGRFEEAVSGLVALYHHMGRIRWSRVPLRDRFGEESGLSADTIVSPSGIFVPEFPLLHSTAEEERIWGGMRIDLLYFDLASQTIGFVDSKLGSRFHYDPTPDKIQPARYLDRIVRLASTRPKSFFMFATSYTLFKESGIFAYSPSRLRGFRAAASVRSALRCRLGGCC